MAIMTKGERENKELKAKVKELEQFISTQQKLIEILKSMPGKISLKEGNKSDGIEKSNSVDGRLQRKCGAVAPASSTGLSKNRKPDAGSHNAHAKLMEKEAPKEARA
jgi:hypothetical protein